MRQSDKNFVKQQVKSWHKTSHEMHKHEKAAIIGFHRNGIPYGDIGNLMGIGTYYAEQIVKEYLKKKSEH